MREFLKRAKADYLLSSVLCIVLGIIFVVWKGGVIDVIGTLLSIAMIIVGNYLSGKLYFEPCNIWSINDCRNSGTCSWNLVSHPAVADCQSGSGYTGCRTCISWNSCGDGGCECQKIRI